MISLCPKSFSACAAETKAGEGRGRATDQGQRTASNKAGSAACPAPELLVHFACRTRHYPWSCATAGKLFDPRLMDNRCHTADQREEELGGMHGFRPDEHALLAARELVRKHFIFWLLLRSKIGLWTICVTCWESFHLSSLQTPAGTLQTQK